MSPCHALIFHPDFLLLCWPTQSVLRVLATVDLFVLRSVISNIDNTVSSLSTPVCPHSYEEDH